MDQAFFEQRRQRVLASMGPHDVAIFASGGEQIRSRDTTYRFRPSSDVYYLTGFQEPEAVVVLAPGHESGPLIMFVRPRDKDKEIWNGRRAGVEGARERFGADEAHTIDAFAQTLPGLLKGAQTLHYRLGGALDGVVLGAMEQVRGGREAFYPTAIRDTRELTHPLRLIKTPQEIDAMRRACEVTAEAHLAAMKACRPGLREYQLQAVIEFTFLKHGAIAPAYETIVGAGDNATILHYTENRDVIADGALVLIDAGAELGYYAGDITRTFPANGRFTGPQRDLYQAVLEAQIAGVEMCTTGRTWLEIHDHTVKLLTRSMVDLGLLKGDVDALIEDEAYRQFYMHKTGHWLGMDVHDVGAYYQAPQEATPLVPGMIQTIEPGIYIQPGTEGVDEVFWGMGVRIEDDVLTTAEGFEVLTDGVPKSVEGIEAVVGTGVSLSL